MDEEETAPAAPSVLTRIVETVSALLPSVDLLVISDYGKGLVLPDLAGQVIRMAHDIGPRVVVDSKAADYSPFKGAFLLTPNRAEAARAAGVAPDRPDSLVVSGTRLLETLAVEAVLITRSEEGMTLFERGREPVDFPTRARTVYDVTGAGDTVVATIGLALAAGASLTVTAELANLAGGIAVEQVGTSAITEDQLRRALRDGRLREGPVPEGPGIKTWFRCRRGMPKAAVFLDRDGVINRDRSDYVKTWEEFEFLPGVLEAFRLLAPSPHRVVVVSNQSAIGRGLVSRETVEEIHARMTEAVRRGGGRIDAVFYCPHRPDEDCLCRKPRPGLLLQAARELDIDLPASWLIGDDRRDLGERRGSGSPAYPGADRARKGLHGNGTGSGALSFRGFRGPFGGRGRAWAKDASPRGHKLSTRFAGPGRWPLTPVRGREYHDFTRGMRIPIRTRGGL